MTRFYTFTLGAALTLLLSGCSQQGATTPGTIMPADYVASLPSGAAQQKILCARENQDVFSQWYCGTHPVITSLEDVLEGVGLKDPANPDNLSFALTGHSTSLVSRHTTSLNPRAIIFTPPGTANYMALGFARGDHVVEVAAFDPRKQDINFYLIHYTKACDPYCPNSERFTPETERNWGEVTVYGDADLSNTPLDCMPCHEPAGFGTPRMLRMQEFNFPWTHWFNQGTASSVLQTEFVAAHNGEDYAGIPADLLDISNSGGFVGDPPIGEGPAPTSTPASNSPNSGVGIPAPGGSCGIQTNGGVPTAGGDATGTPISSQPFFGGSGPAQLQAFVESAGFCVQPNEFLGGQIEQEGRGPTWLAIDANAVNGSMISVPLYAVDPFDPAKLGAATKRYQAAKTLGGLDEGLFPDLTDLFPEPEFGDLGFQASPLAVNGTMVVQHRCGFCHSGLFPGISRNNFDVNQFPGNLSPTERAEVLWRIRLPADNIERMPPRQFSDLTETQLQMVESALT